jgi:hypothetical protein
MMVQAKRLPSILIPEALTPVAVLMTVAVVNHNSGDN